MERFFYIYLMKRVSPYELSNHLGNVLTVITDRKIPVDANNDFITDYYLPDVISSTDYYAFGAPMPGRNYQSSSKYRYGMNGQEKDDEVFGSDGTSYTAEFWQYDARLGRRWNIDPVKKPWQSDYSCFSNSPIWKVDPDGDDDFFNSKGVFLYSDDKKTRTIHIVNEKGVKQQLKDYSFNKDNAKTLTNIGAYYAKSAGLDVKSLGGGSLSVANRTSKSNSSGQIEYESNSVYNQGTIATGSDIMNHNDKTNRISISLYYGKVSSVLNDGNNFISVLRHEKTHGEFTTNDGFEHLSVYYKQINSPEFAKTTPELKAAVFDVVNEIFNALDGYNNKSYTKEQNEAIRNEGKKWKEKYKPIYEKYKEKK